MTSCLTRKKEQQNPKRIPFKIGVDRNSKPPLKKQSNTTMGWEVSQAKESSSVKERMLLTKKELTASLIGLFALFIIFCISCWLAQNPFETTQRIASTALTHTQWIGTDQWGILWPVVFMAIVFEFLDSAAGMGYGTAFTPMLLIMGFDPLQVIPVIMIQQACAGLISAYIHKEYGNVEWGFNPPSETVKLWAIIAGTGVLAVVFSITAIYGVLKLATIWIKLYVVILLLAMGIIAFLNSKKATTYHPKRMAFFGGLAGFNKGIGGGGYGPVVTIGGLLSGIPTKTMMAITAFSEGTVCVASIIVWFSLLNYGVTIDFVLLPSMMLGSILAVIAAPYATRVLPEIIWRRLVPVYCCILAGVSFWKLIPSLF